MTTQKTAAEGTPVTATLVEGMFFDYKNQVWDNHKAGGPGKAVREIDSATEAYLRENAIIYTEVDGKDYEKPRFTFSNDAPKTVRRRQRD